MICPQSIVYLLSFVHISGLEHHNPDGYSQTLCTLHFLKKKKIWNISCQCRRYCYRIIPLSAVPLKRMSSLLSAVLLKISSSCWLRGFFLTTVISGLLIRAWNLHVYFYKAALWQRLLLKAPNNLKLKLKIAQNPFFKHYHGSVVKKSSTICYVIQMPCEIWRLLVIFDEP